MPTENTTETMPAERLVRVGDVELAVQEFGASDAPTVLLIMGAGASMLHWDEDLCQRIADHGRRVVRYDHRDTGRSTAWPPGSPGYTLRDLEADAIGLLNALDIDRGHLVGMSMGAAITQLLGIDHPDRAASLTLMASTPGGPGHDAPDLPGMSDALAAMFSGDDPAEQSSVTGPDDVVQALVDGERPFGGSLAFDEPRWRSVAERSVARARSVASAENHFLLDPGEPWRDRLGAITAPTLVMHGSADPLLPLPHGEALARAIPGARLIVLDGVGHEPPPRTLHTLVAQEIATHTA